eukprot:1156636-Pelagomonas_calceolata.AAC.28
MQFASVSMAMAALPSLALIAYGSSQYLVAADCAKTTMHMVIAFSGWFIGLNGLDASQFLRMDALFV